MNSPSHLKTIDLSDLDTLTGGAFSAPTAGERSARIREWLSSTPSPEQLASVFKELSVKDKGAAKIVREKIDEARRTKGQELLAVEWANKAQTLLALAKLNIADAMAWQRDAAKVGAPLSKEPLLSLKTALAERVRSIEDLQHQVQVQREAAVLLTQRVEVLSTKPLADANTALASLGVDVEHWQAQASSLVASSAWASVDVRFASLLEASRSQLLAVWNAFEEVLALANTAANDPAAALPPVPVWADELRALRGVESAAAPKAAKPTVDPQLRAQANAAVQEILQKLEAEVSQGHGKATAGAAAALRQALKDHGKLIDNKLEGQAHAVLAAAGELEGWQRWRADQLREELLQKAQALLQRPEGQAIGGRKMQEQLRTLREQWKQTDQGGVPNHILWKKFDEACNEAYKVVEAWLEKAKAESAQNKAQRLALIEEVKAWAADNLVAKDGDWKGFNRVLHQFAERWRDGGHVGEKVFAELQPLWKQAMATAAAPLEALQATSMTLRHAMIEEATELAAHEPLRIDALRALQQRWQAEASRVPIDRRQEQKLWDAFRKPIDEAFNRKSAEREKAHAELSAREKVVLDAAKALQQANHAGDAQAIRAAMAALDAALKGQTPEPAPKADAVPETAPAPTSATAPETPAVDAPADPSAAAPAEAVQTAAQAVTSDEPAAPLAEGADAVAQEPAPSTEATNPAPKPAPKPVRAVRGDDRPGMKPEVSTAGADRFAKRGDRKDAPRGGRDARDGRDSRDAHGAKTGRPRPDGRNAGDAATHRVELPRLSDPVFRAQRDALEGAQLALKRLASQAHGEALVHLLEAWQKRDTNLIPSGQELGSAVSATLRSAWVQALAQQASAPSKNLTPAQALLRLEIAAELPTAAQHLTERRMMQLQLLTQRNAPSPQQTWGNDVAVVLAGAHDEDSARRLQAVLKVLLKR